MSEGEVRPHTADRDAVIQLLNEEADIRLTTMIGFGYIERYLGELIRNHLGEIPASAKDYLLKRSIKHLSDRIEFAHKLGALEKGVAHNLVIFSQIRHRFAHHVQAVDCTDPEIARLIEKLHLVKQALREASAEDVSAENRLRLMILVSVLKLHDLIESPYG
ncbi:hypothetical protein IM511_09795 [Erythrobacteraceae bacterium E2-1 Yellow Sea]|nr:hypothetical protein [Erythrobacteraceae bacterium E2-1 Yellow Sea]